MNGTIAVVGETYFSAVKNPMVAFLFPESLMTSDKFKKKRKSLEAKGLLYAPRRPHRNVIEGDYEPPTMETDPTVLEKLANTTFKKKTRPKRLTGDTLQVEIEKPDDEEPEVKPKKKLVKKKVEAEEDDEEFEE